MNQIIKEFENGFPELEFESNEYPGSGHDRWSTVFVKMDGATYGRLKFHDSGSGFSHYSTKYYGSKISNTYSTLGVDRPAWFFMVAVFFLRYGIVPFPFEEIPGMIREAMDKRKAAINAVNAWRHTHPKFKEKEGLIVQIRRPKISPAWDGEFSRIVRERIEEQSARIQSLKENT